MVTARRTRCSVFYNFSAAEAAVPRDASVRNERTSTGAGGRKVTAVTTTMAVCAEMTLFRNGTGPTFVGPK